MLISFLLKPNAACQVNGYIMAGYKYPDQSTLLLCIGEFYGFRTFF